MRLFAAYAGLSLKRKIAWGIIGLILLQGLFLSAKRFLFGLGTVTNLSDQFPWGLWIGFDVISGVALAAGGFTLCFLVYIFGYHQFHSVVRPTVLTAFLGYGLVAIGLLYDLGKYFNIWHPVVMWNPHSVMFEVAWCVMLYLFVLFLEFLPILLEKFGMIKTKKAVEGLTIPIVILGVILSTLHQSSLGSVFLIVPEKLHPLWYTPILPLLFFLSAVAVGPAMVIAESYFSSRVFRRGLELRVLAELARAMQVAVILYVAVKIQDLYVRHVTGFVFTKHYESVHFIIEVGLLCLAVLILSFRRLRTSKAWLVAASAMVVIGVAYNRLNVSWIGMLRTSGSDYVPAWSEIGVSVFLLTAGFVVFYFIVKKFPVFPPEGSEHQEAVVIRNVKERLAHE